MSLSEGSETGLTRWPVEVPSSLIYSVVTWVLVKDASHWTHYLPDVTMSCQWLPFHNSGLIHPMVMLRLKKVFISWLHAKEVGQKSLCLVSAGLPEGHIRVYRMHKRSQRCKNSYCMEKRRNTRDVLKSGLVTHLWINLLIGRASVIEAVSPGIP